jgi:peptidoglycan hydrolase CwlO-like protein
MILRSVHDRPDDESSTPGDCHRAVGQHARWLAASDASKRPSNTAIVTELLNIQSELVQIQNELGSVQSELSSVRSSLSSIESDVDDIEDGTCSNSDIC